MKLKQYRWCRVILTCVLSMGVLNLFGQNGGFASKLKSAIEAVEKDANKDPDTFKKNIAQLEKDWGTRQDPVEQSVVHALLGSAYREMRWTSISDYDEETRGDYVRKLDNHFDHVLDNMDALAAAKSSNYSVLLTKGKDSDLYENDMLSVLISFVMSETNWDAWKNAEVYRRAFEVYKRRGNLNGYGQMKSKWLNLMREVPRKYGAITEKQKQDSLYQLLQEVKDVEIGADIALAYSNHIYGSDERINFLRWALENLGKSKRKGDLQNSLEMVLHPEIYMSSVEDFLANRANEVSVRFWNGERAMATVRKYAGREKTKNGWGALLTTGAVVEQHEVVLAIDSANAARKAQNLPVRGWAKTSFTLPAGHYVLVTEGVGDKEVSEFRVSSLHLMTTDVDKEKIRLYVVDNETGRPVAGAKVQCRERIPSDKDKTEGWENRDLKYEYTTDADGTVDIESKLWYRVVKSQDDYTNYTNAHAYWSIPREKVENVNLKLMTDRSIYRPGQKVMGSVVAFWQKGDEVKVVAGDSVRMRVVDSQRKELTTLSLLTNEYGTASFEFMLPDGCAVGSWNLNVSSDAGGRLYETLRVEEYKRPTYDVTIEGPRGAKFGEKIEAVGTAMMLAGVPVQGANVHYKVECQSRKFRWWYERNNDWQEMEEGDITTDEEGQFRVAIPLTDEYVSGDYPVVRFRVKARVTDVAGESHDAEWGINVSNIDRSVDVTVDRMTDMAKKPFFQVDVFNANHEKVETEGKYRILYGDKAVAEGSFAAGDTLQLPQNLQLGVNYSIEATIIDNNGQEMKERAYFTPYNSTQPVTDFRAMGMDAKYRAEGQPKESDLFYAPKTEFEENGHVDIYFSTAETDAYIIYNVYNANGLLETQRAVTDGTMKHLCLKYRKEWGEGINVRVMYVRNGHYRLMNQNFTLARPEKKLKLEWATFRDKLQPGQEEQWTLTVTNKDGRRVNGAELMAVLYDASLDRIYHHDWDFGLYFSRFTPSVSSSHALRSSFPSSSLSGDIAHHSAYSRSFDQLNGFEHDRYLRRSKSAGMVLESRAAVEDDGVVYMHARMAVDEAPAANEAGTAIADEETEDEPVDYENATIRENFAETAFFLPHLVSDKQGNVNIQFTLPESLTEWRFIGFAHTKDVDYGKLYATATARKSFMLRPNMPRFLRWGDKAVIAASVVNQSEEALKGGVRMRLLNPATGDVVLTMEKPFSVEAGKTVGLDFGFDVKEEWTDLDCEIIAVSGNVSDGEKNPLPVLSTKKEMVEAVPYYIMGNSDGSEVTKTMDLSQLYNQNSATATNRTLKVEYTDNPVWMCIEALRSVKNPVDDDAIDFAASLYANTRLVELMQTFPVMEKHESSEDLKQRVATAEQKLAGLQLEDGGWSWFKGMQSSYYTTLAVCEHLAKIPKPNEKVKRMLADGMKYLDDHELKAYKYAKLKKYKIWPSNSELRYLYVSALMPDRAVSKEVSQMREDYLSRVEKTPEDLTIYGVANAAYTLRAFGHVKLADKFVNFLKDYTVEKPGQGRFFATDAAYYSWMDYRIPTQVAAMKAIYQKDRKDAILNEMQLWLISQKQVQKWDNPMNTIDVADFLLQVSPMENFHETKYPVLVVDGSELKDLDYGTINTERDELEGRKANLILEGNVLADAPEELLNDGAQQLEVKKQTPGISWGAAYATFLEDVGNLKLYATNELKIQRKIYVQHAGSDDWADYQEGDVLKVGDKVKIRHIITADRDMDFVRVSAQHPACLEPLRHLSGYQWMGGRGCYLSIHDARFDMFFDWFTRGTSTVDMEYSVVRAGSYQVGVSTVECVYAKQFGGHTEGMMMHVKSDK
ncbi:MAG: hypothetical protein IJP75_01745 [Bacteroidaceae bacterium]|nr:hypothetical protein [Bacteroidaceae bacterium]